MSWIGGYKAPSNTAAELAESREAKRKKLEADRAERAKQRESRQKQLRAAIEARKEADQALEDLQNLDPDIFAGESVEEVSDTILDEGENETAIMVDFDQENGDDSATAMDNLRSVQCPFNKGDIEFWFSQLEDQLTLIGVKKQWTKKIALVRFLPPEIQNEVKSLLKLGQTAAGNDIYFRIKTTPFPKKLTK